MFWVILIIVGLVIIAIFNKKEVMPPPTPPPNPPEPVPDPDPHYWKWQLVDETTERWKDYTEYMKRITSDTLVALEMKFYKWVSDWDLFHKEDYWDLPDEVWENKKADCDGLARLSGDMLGRFVKIPEVWWLEYYGFYRDYYYDKETDEWEYKIKAAGHAITVYKKDEKLLAFSNTSWWNNQDFQDFVEIGEQTFPEGLYWIIARDWSSGKMQWQLKAKEKEILVGTNIFHRRLKRIKSIKNLDVSEVVRNYGKII